MTFRIVCILLVNLLVFNWAAAQRKVRDTKQDYKVATIAFYNLENLFDTVQDTSINDEEFLPQGKKAWTLDKFEEKIANMAYVISQIGTDLTDGPSLVGVCEVENRYVLEQLVAHPLLAEKQYKIIHQDSPDERGIDVALLYRENQFEPVDTQLLTLMLLDDEGERNFTRDILLVSGNLDGEKIHLMVNHWPSRSGGEARSKPGRIAAAKLCRTATDSIISLEPNAKIFIMGDLNDDPTSESVKSHLRAKKSIKELHEGDIYNPMFDFYRRGIGSNAYRDAWSLFDQLMCSEAVTNKDQEGYFYFKANVFNKKFLVNPSGQYKGYPHRTFAGSSYVGGYSDHFPVYMHLIKKI